LSARIGIDSGLVVIGKGAGQYETAPFRRHEVPVSVLKLPGDSFW
jgi:hypothetical protein